MCECSVDGNFMSRHVYDLDSILLLSTKPSEIFIVCKDGSGLICNGSEVILKQNIPFNFFGEACSLYFTSIFHHLIVIILLQFHRLSDLSPLLM